MHQLKDLKNPNNTVIDATFDLLKEGDKRIKLSKNKNLVLVLGNVQSGKTSVVQWLTGDNSKLISKEVNEGSGEFIIDDGGRIGNSTIFPELVEDAETSSVYYDCPGFGDTTSTSYDMAKTYFVKKMADYAESIKIVFVVNYNSVRMGTAEEDFMKLVQHATEFVGDVNKFSGSLSMVASKVDNSYVKVGNDLKLVSDQVIIKSIVNFLEGSKQRLEAKQKQFVEALLVKNGNDYAKIGIFRRPDKPGPLSDIELLQSGKKVVKKIVHDLVFTKKSEKDFGYTLSETSKNQINSLVEEINGKVSYYAQSISVEVKQFYQKLKKQITDKMNSFSVDDQVQLSEAKDFTLRINDGRLVLSNMTKAIDHLSTPKELAETIQTGLKKLGIKASNESLANIVYQDKYFSFLQLVSEKEWKVSPTEFATDLQTITSDILKLRDEVRSNSTQLIETAKTKIEIEVQEIGNKIRKYQRSKLGKSEFHKLLNESNELYEFTLKVKLSDLDLNSLKDFVQKVNYGFQNLDTDIVRNTVAITKLGDQWQFLKVLRGDASTVNDPLFVKLWTTFLETMQRFKQWMTFVENVYKRLSEYDIQQDKNKCIEDLGFNEDISLDKFSQFLERIEKYGVADVLQGTTPDEEELKLLNEALELTLKNKIDLEFRENELVIKGDFVKLSDLTEHWFRKDFKFIFALNKMFIDVDLDCSVYDDSISSDGDKTPILRYNYIFIIAPSLEIIGQRKIKLSNWGSSYFLAIGKGLIERGSLTVSKEREEIQKSKWFNDFSYDYREKIILNTPTAMVNSYKSLLRKNLDNKFKNDKLIQFYDFLEKNVFRTLCLDLVNELKTIEEQFIDLNRISKTDLTHIYQSFLGRVYNMAENLDKNDKGSEQRKVLSYLYTSILSKMSFLEINKSSLVIDVSGYLDLVSEDIQTLKDLQDKDTKLNLIKKYKNEYKERIDKKIEEGNDLVKKEMLPELDKIGEEINKDLDELVKEVIELEREAEEDKEKLIAKRHQLEDQLAVHTGLNFLKFLGLALSFLGGWGALAGAVIEGGAAIGDSLALGDQDLPPLNLKDKDIQNLNDILERIKRKRIDELNGMLENLSNDLEDFRKAHNNSDELKDLEETVNSVRERLKKTASGKEVRDLQEELKQALVRKEKELKNYEISAKGGGDALKAVTDMLDKVNSIVTLGIDTYNQYKNDKGKLATINNAIQQIENTILKLKEYEDAIHDMISPMLHDMEDDLKKVVDSLKNQTQVSLDVSRYRMQSTLRNMKLQIHELTQGFKVEGRLARCIEQEEEAMNTIINIYEHIENYHDQQNLANYIANICSASAGLINVTDPNLVQAIEELEITIRSNILLEQYRTTIDALKQWVFPFAQVYLQELKLPEQFKPEKNLENQVTEAKSEIEKIKRKVALYKTSVQKSDQYIHNGEFSSKYRSTKPFFVWKNEEHNKLISALLSGEEVLAKADILDSPKGKSGIKFNLVELNLKAKNETMQGEINEKLVFFQISATHLGNSYYECDKKVYSIASPSQTIQYSFEKKEDGTPVDENDVYKKIKDGDLMLSPYAMWKLKLIETQSASFEDLKKYKDEIDLELVGFGGYIADGINISTLHVDDYYQRDDTVFVNENAEKVSFLGGLKNMTSRLLAGLFQQSGNQDDFESTESVIGHYPNDNFAAGDHPKITSSNENALRTINGSVDAIGNLLLGQIVVGKLYGTNKHLNGSAYISPDLRRSMKVNELTRTILPALKRDENED